MKKDRSILNLSALPFLLPEEKNNPDRFVFRVLKKKEPLSPEQDGSYRMLFLQRGYGVIQIDREEFLYLNEGECLLLGPDSMLFYALEDSAVTLWNLSENWYTFDCFLFHLLHSGKMANSSSVCSFPVVPTIRNFLTILQEYYQDKRIPAEKLNHLKQRELLILFRHYYTKEQLVALFYPLFCHINKS